MNRRTSRTDFKDDLTPEQVEELLHGLCEARRALCTLQRGLYPLSEAFNQLERLKREIDRCQARWTGNLAHFYAGHAVIEVDPAND